jgi:hypothetical protein
VIPKVIHQTFRSWDQMPEALVANVEKIRRDHPAWEYRFYSDADCLDFIASEYSSEVLRLYQSIRPVYGAARADLFRYLLMLKVGGVYLDIKSTADRPLSELIRDDDRMVLAQWTAFGTPHEGWGRHRELAETAGGEFVQWMIIAAPQHPFLAAVVATVVERLRAYQPFEHFDSAVAVIRTTGPIAYTQAIVATGMHAPHRFLTPEEAVGLRYTISPKSRLIPGYSGRYSTLLSVPGPTGAAWALLARLRSAVRTTRGQGG